MGGVISSRYDIPRYTPQGYQDTYDKFVFGKQVHLNTQSSSSRARLLNSMYSELITESVKKDPYLRNTGDTGCDTIRGRRQPMRNIDC